MEKCGKYSKDLYKNPFGFKEITQISDYPQEDVYVSECLHFHEMFLIYSNNLKYMFLLGRSVFKKRREEKNVLIG